MCRQRNSFLMIPVENGLQTSSYGYCDNWSPVSPVRTSSSHLGGPKLTLFKREKKARKCFQMSSHRFPTIHVIVHASSASVYLKFKVQVQMLWTWVNVTLSAQQFHLSKAMHIHPIINCCGPTNLLKSQKDTSISRCTHFFLQKCSGSYMTSFDNIKGVWQNPSWCRARYRTDMN